MTSEHYCCETCGACWPGTIEGAKAAAQHEREQPHHVEVRIPSTAPEEVSR